MEKGEIAQNEQFHLSPQCFLCNLYLKILYWPHSVVVQFKFDENGKKFSIWVENVVGKGEIAR